MLLYGNYAGNFTIYLAMFSYSGSDMMSSLNQNNPQQYASLANSGITIIYY